MLPAVRSRVRHLGVGLNGGAGFGQPNTMKVYHEDGVVVEGLWDNPLDNGQGFRITQGELAKVRLDPWIQAQIDGKILKLVPVVEAVPVKVAKPVKAEKAE